MNKIKYCNHCSITKENMRGAVSEDIANFGAGYLIGYNTDILECPFCHKYLIDIPISEDDFLCIRKVSHCNKDLLEAMIKLHDENIIEYETRMSQFRTQVQQQEQIKKQQQEDSKPHCPTCNSTDIEKISLTKKAFGATMFGLFSSDVRKTMHCKNCGYKW